MLSRRWLALLPCLFLSAPAFAADAPPAVLDYAVVTSETTLADPAWKNVVDALAKKHGDAPILTFKDSVDEVRPALAEALPNCTCFVVRPEEAGRKLVVAVSRMTRKLNDDPYTDTRWGILTGYTPEAALKIVNETKPLIIRKGAAGTGLDLSVFDEGLWYSEGTAGQYARKTADGKVEELKGPQDSTQELVNVFNEFHTDLFLTSGHATERDWQPGYSYRNGQFRCKDGVVVGLDMKGNTLPVQSDNPKVYLPLGNCLMGHIKDRQCMALAFMNSAGVRQMAGYTVSTWFGYGGWGIKDYFMGQPGRFTLAESFFLNNQALENRLEREYPGKAQDVATNFNLESDPATLGRIAAALGYRNGADPKKVQEHLGLIWDRDTVGFYGDPAWEARLVERNLPWQQKLEIKNGTYTLTVTAEKGADCGRPVAAVLPHHIKDAQVVEGQELKPLIASNFVMLPELKKLEPGKTYRVVFKAAVLGSKRPHPSAAPAAAPK